MNNIEYLIDEIKEFIENIFLSGFENISSKDIDKLNAIIISSKSMNMIYLYQILKKLSSCITVYQDETSKKALMDSICQLDFYVKYVQM